MSARLASLILGVCALAASAAWAAAPQIDLSPQTQTKAEDRYTAFLVHSAKMGPAKIALRDQAVLDLPQGYAFLPEKAAADFMKRIGNTTDENFLGIVLPAQKSTWFVFLEYIPSGYIKDDDARTWNVDTMLQTIRDNTNADNERRRKLGIPGLEVLGWAEKPHYETSTHRLVWSIAARNKGVTDPSQDIANYKTLALGREGYITLVMVTDLSAIPSQKVFATTLLSGVNFNSSKRYTDFDSSTDRVAEYGLAALIGGIAIKKLGLFALAAAFFVKAAKFIAIAAIAAVAWLRRLFGLKAKAPETVTSDMRAAAPPVTNPAEAAEPK